MIRGFPYTFPFLFENARLLLSEVTVLNSGVSSSLTEYPGMMYNRVVTDIINLTDTTSFWSNLSYSRSISNTLSISDTITKLMYLKMVVVDPLLVNGQEDTLFTLATGGVSKVLSDTIYVGYSVSKTVNKLLSESISIATTILRSVKKLVVDPIILEYILNLYYIPYIPVITNKSIYDSFQVDGNMTSKYANVIITDLFDGVFIVESVLITKTVFDKAIAEVDMRLSVDQQITMALTLEGGGDL